jgi:hypothetical protein
VSLSLFDTYAQAVELLDQEIAPSLQALQLDNPDVNPQWAGVPGKWW